jgi:GTPase SAR1 family protein
LSATAGQEKFRSIVQQYYKGAMGIILTYSVTDRKSFQNIELWMKQISSQAPDAVIILVGNKCDLEPEIQNEQGEQLAKNHNIKFFETSAKTGKNVEEIFQALARDIRNKLGEDHLKEMEKKIIRPEGGAKQEAPTLKLDPGRNSKQNSDSKCSC